MKAQLINTPSGQCISHVDRASADGNRGGLVLSPDTRDLATRFLGILILTPEVKA